MNKLDQARSKPQSPAASPQTEGGTLTGAGERRPHPDEVLGNGVRPYQGSELPIQDAQPESQDPESKIQNAKRPYARTPARVAAWYANLQKAQAAPKEKRYRSTPKRRAASLANLAKARAARRRELEQGVERLDLAFPPIFEVADDGGFSTSDSGLNTPLGDGQPQGHQRQGDAGTEVKNATGETPDQQQAPANDRPTSSPVMAPPKPDAVIQNQSAKIQNPWKPQPVIRGPRIGRNQPCPCGSGKKYKKCHGGPTAVAKGTWPTGNPPGGRPFQNHKAETEGGRPSMETAKPKTPDVQRPPLVWAIGWPEGCQGADRSARGYAELEKVSRTILRRRRAVRGAARREGRQVMHLLTEAAERTVAPALQEILALACALISILAHSRVLNRGDGLDRRISRLFDAFLQQRYDPLGTVFDWREEWRRARALEKEGRETRRQSRQYRRQMLGLPPLPERKARPRPKPEAGTEAPAERKRTPPAGPRPAAGPHLPETYREFRALLGRAFFAPAVEPEDGAIRLTLEELACVLWDRLTLFETGLAYGKENLDEVLDEMAPTLPDGRELLIRQDRIQDILKPNPNAEVILKEYLQALRQDLGILLKERYEPDAEIDRFCQAD